MDIAKFNQELSYKVAKANGLEKHKRFQEAIDLWLDISEMALNASKTPNIEVYYKSMIIEKTKQIINHIKDLKSKLYDQKGSEQISRQEVIPPPRISHSEPSEDPKLSSDIEALSDIDKAKIIENSEIKNLPIGFKEIEAPEDFKIITPHDQNYVKKILNQDHDMSIFTNDNKEVKDQSQTPPDQPLDKTKNICFACGSEIPANSEVCSSCGTNLK
ncbi:MAG: zinc ribbon domain-containing protein [Candidatus Lokiarchaeota archaeon]|nr:zinc ribbon domain-containing protein [Candidatus Lokiarchaeota archaeon]